MMKQAIATPATDARLYQPRLLATAGPSSLITRFGDVVDVRNRGTLRVARYAGDHMETRNAPAVVRIWTDEQCRELNSHQARVLAAQLLEAANLVDTQNNH
jgi:hypothetical protein